MDNQTEKCGTLSVRQAVPTNECIKVDKVYDWVIVATDQTQEIPVPSAALGEIENARSLGHQLLVTGTINLPEDVVTTIVSVIRKTIIINGVPVQVGCAQILKTITLNVAIYDICVSTTTPITTFTSTFQILERAGICFPEPFTADNIDLNVSSAVAISLSSVPVNGNLLFEIGICQDLQVVTEVKLEVLGRFCEPRENTIDCGTSALTCTKPVFPAQCPSIFPVE